MKVQPSQNVAQKPVEMEGSHGCRVRWLLSESDGTPNFAMREFEVAPGGYTPRHSHPYEHEVYVLAGEGVVYEGDSPHAFNAGDVILVNPDEVHQFRNTGASPLKFLCLIPNDATKTTVTVAPECGTE
jgi:quercetin dioxygenase-like cupin family protein